MKLTCPKCRAVSTVTGSDVAGVVACPECGHEGKTRAPSADRQHPPPSLSSPEPAIPGEPTCYRECLSSAGLVENIAVVGSAVATVGCFLTFVAGFTVEKNGLVLSAGAVVAAVAVLLQLNLVLLLTRSARVLVEIARTGRAKS